MNVLKWLIEFIGWLQIVASPLLIGLVIGAFIYFPDPSIGRLILGSSVAALGLIIGIIWATKEWKGNGTIWFLSRNMATPDLDRTADVSRNTVPSIDENKVDE